MLKRIIIHMRTSAKLIFLLLIATFFIISFIFCEYRPTYSVTLDGKFIGYCSNKNELQERIEKTLENGNGEYEAFIQIDKMPEYNLCLLKREIKTNEEDIYKKVTESGTTYYRMYALVENGEEKLYVSNFEDAENIVNQLKEKDSSNKEDISILEKYDAELKEFTNVEESVARLYKEKEIKNVQVASTKQVATTRSTQTTKTTTVQTSFNKQTNLGISFIKPTTGTVTSVFGQRWGRSHTGIDIGAPKGTPIYAAASGTVTYSGNKNDGYGNYIILSNGNGVTTYYAHCSELLVSKGETVQQGQLIAKVGSTGNSTGNHLHFEIRVNGVAQNPQNYVY